MLKSLYVKNYALIEELEIDFSDKLNIITGETGAGKSIMLGALGLVMGKRADVKVLADEQTKCIVEARYDISKDGLQAFFEENDLEYSDELIIRREILPSGKSRAFVNDSPGTLDVLAALSDGLIDLHQQFDTLDLYKTSFQVKVLDALAGNKDNLQVYQTTLKSYRNTKNELLELKSNRNSKAKELDFLKYQLGELDQVKLQENEYEILEEELEVLSNTEGIKSVSMAIYNGLEQGEPAVLSFLQDLIRQTGSMQSKDKRFVSVHERLIAVAEEIKDLASEAERIFDHSDFDQKRTNYVQERLASIHKLLKKHQLATSAELLQLMEDTSNNIKSIDVSDEVIEGLELKLEKIEVELEKNAKSLTQKRIAIVPDLKKKILDVLALMAMPSAEFEININPNEEYTEQGRDIVEFYFSANKGVKVQKLKDVASGGETSRFALAIKSIIANAMHLSTMIFDEIDTGISGEVAHRMGKIMKDLSEKHQIITITHSPQIASKADNHYFVFKKEEGNRTTSGIKLLDDESRVEEIAKMLSGDHPSLAAIANAKSLLNDL